MLPGPFLTRLIKLNDFFVGTGIIVGFPAGITCGACCEIRMVESSVMKATSKKAFVFIKIFLSIFSSAMIKSMTIFPALHFHFNAMTWGNKCLSLKILLKHISFHI